MSVERVYIGGMDPTRGLTVQDVLARLQQAVQLRDISVNTHYCHVNAVSLQQDRTALDILKLYNNVKWKGCKIQVQAAKPHFLERLVQERKDREQTTTCTQPDETPTVIPRHLKVKRGYGQESYKVDTKPCRVTSWSAFAKMRKRLIQKQQQQHELQQPITPRKQAYWNRAVHLRFDNEAAENLPKEPQLGVTNQVDEFTESLSSSESALDSTSSDSSEASSSGKMASQGAYIWSDDDSEQQDETTRLVDSTVRSSEQNEWKKLALDEFVAGVDDNTKANNLNDLDSSGSVELPGSVKTTDEVDLERDVKTNLKVLADLFPELSGRTPLAKYEKSNDEKNQSPGWGPQGQILRYDPTKQSAGQFVLESQDRKTDQAKEECSLEEDTQRESKQAHDVYEQDRLERVFRDAREPDATESDKLVDESGFSFGFQLPDQKPTEDSFSFSFNFPEETIDTTNNHSSEPDHSDKGTEITNELVANNDERGKKRRKLFFAEEDIDHYVELFYSMDDGKRIMEDLEGFRNDPKVQEDWEKQRRILTQDWKRKRKHAQQQRRRRFQR